MKINCELSFLDIDNQKMGVPIGGENDFHGILKMNGTAKRIVELLSVPTTEEAIAAKLAEEYDAPAETIQKNVHTIVTALREKGLISD